MTALLPDKDSDYLSPRTGAAAIHAFARTDDDGAGQSLTLRDLLSFLLGHWVWLLIAAVVFAAVGVTVGSVKAPRYEAEGLLVIDTAEVNIPELQTVRSNATVDPWAARSEARILASRELVGAAVSNLRLLEDPNFNPVLRLSLRFRLLGSLSLPFLSAGTPGVETVDDPQATALTKTIANIRRDLEVASEERSYAINVSYLGREPKSAANFVNELMEAYVAQDVEARRAAAIQAGIQLKARMDALYLDLQATRDEIRAREARTESIVTVQGTISAQDAAALAEERRRLRAERLRVGADLAQLQAAVAGNGLNLLNDKLVTPRLRALWQTEAALQRTLAENALNFGPRHPRMISFQNEIEKVRTELRAEVLAIKVGLQERAATLGYQEELLGERLRDASIAAATSAEGRAALDQLGSEARSKQALYDRYRERYEQTIANQAIFGAKARIASRAEPPVEPSGPSPPVQGAVGGVLGMTLVAAWLVGRRWMHDDIESLDEAVRVSGAKPLGAIPRVGGNKAGRGFSDLVARFPQGTAAETVRGILHRLGAGRHDNPLRIVMVTSPTQRDGKSSLVAAMARIGARDGLRCLAIDCDFHRAGLGRLVGLRPQAYLNDFAEHAATLDDLIVGELGGAHFILARPVGHCSWAFLRELRLELLGQSLRSRYDLVIIDTPPVMSVVDPMVISLAADAIVLVLPWRAAGRELVREVVRRIAGFGCPLAGVVLSRARGREHERYGYRGYAGQGV
jgi:polysaccharide biosynthesis transport protein